MKNNMYAPIYEIEIGEIYYTTHNKRPFKVIDFSRHGQDCSIQLVHYVNLLPTSDYPPNTKWTVEYNYFLDNFLSKGGYNA